MTARGPVELVLRDLIREVVEEVLAERGGGGELITVEAAAQLASVSPKTIRAWAAAGRLKVAGRAGRRLRLRADDVNASIAAGAVRDPSPEELADQAVRELRARRGHPTSRRKP